MKLSGVSPIYRSLLPLLAIVAVLAFLLATPDSTAQASDNYGLTLTTKYCNALPNAAPFTTFGINGNPACTDSTTPGAATTTTTRLDIPIGEMNFGFVTQFIPPDFTITPGTSIPVGDVVGGLESSATLGIGNGACGTAVPVPFILFNVALPDNPANPRASTNIYVPYPEGTSSDQSGIVDPETGTPSGTIIRGRMENGVPATSNVDLLDGVADIAPGSSLAIQEYPDFFLDLFDPDWTPVSPPLDGPFNSGAGTNPSNTLQNPSDGPLPPVLPLAIYGGLTAPQPASDDWVSLYFLVFSPGALPAGGFAAPHPFSTHVSSLGYASVTILTDTSEVVANVSLITDFCSSLLTNTMLLGTSTPGAVDRGNNAAASTGRQGTHLDLTFSFSLRDLDNDGFENALDTCPKVANVDNPQTTTGADLDMLDPACDPNPALNEAGGPIACPGQFLPQTQPGDIDGDCFTNAQDNCPQVFNGLPGDGGDGQANSESGAPDGGPGDAIGDACDTGTANFTQNGVATSVTLSPAVANGHYHSVGIANPVCIGGTDGDGDGWCAATPGENDADANITPALGLSPPDADGDGFSVWIETKVGTDDTKDCSATGTQNDEPLDAYPPDSNDDQLVNITDVNALRPPVFNLLAGKGTNPSYTARLDFNADGLINITDVNALRPPVFNLLVACTQGGPTPQQ